MEQTQQSIVDKIKKLLALQSSPNEAEAALAASRVQELLIKYQLDLTVIREEERSATKRERTTLKRSAMYEWQRSLWATIARANFCFHWITEEYSGRKGGKVKRHTILGSTVNAITVQMLGEYLCDAIERLLPYPNDLRLSRSAVSWRQGCAQRLEQRIHEQTITAQQQTMQSSTGTEVTVHSLYDREYIANYDALCGEGAYARMMARRAAEDSENKPVKEETEAEQRKRARRMESERNKRRAKLARIDWEAYDQGAQAADSISLNKQVNGVSQKVLN